MCRESNRVSTTSRHPLPEIQGRSATRPTCRDGGARAVCLQQDCDPVRTARCVRRHANACQWCAVPDTSSSLHASYRLACFSLCTDGLPQGYHLRNTRDELASAAYLLRGLMLPVVPMLLFSNDARATNAIRARGVAELWDVHRHLYMDNSTKAVYRQWRRKANCTLRQCDGNVAWQSISFWKTSALIQTPFDRTLFLDNDVYVLQPSLVHNLLSQTLRACDIAMPINVDRGGVWQDAPVPQPCNAMIAYRNTSEVVGLLLGALERIVAGSHPGILQRDQDMVFFEWFEARPKLRFLAQRRGLSRRRCCWPHRGPRGAPAVAPL